MRKFYLVYRDRDEKIIQSSIGQLRIDRQSFPFKLSWTHYQVLMTIENPEERSFYEQAAISESWNVQTLKRQYHSSLYERLALSKDKDAVMAMSGKGTTPYRPADILKSPYVLEFAGLDDKSSYHESDLEFAVLNKMQDFLLEMGKGFLGQMQMYVNY